MKKWLLAGSALLFIQIIVAVALNLTGHDFGAFTPQDKLLNFSPDQADRITIADPERNLILLKEDGEWRLPDYFTAPADAGQVLAILDKLAGLKQGMAIATSQGAAERFKVGEENFEKHVVINNGDKAAADFYIGASPGFKKVYARVADRSEVVSVPLNSYELETEPEDWLDQEMLKIEKDRIDGLVMANFKLTRTEKEWHLADQIDTEELDAAKIDSLLTKIAELRIKGLVEANDHPDIFASNPLLSFTVTLDDGVELLYTFAKPADEDDTVLRLSSREYLFEVDNWQVEEIAGFDRVGLLKGIEEEKK